MSIGSVSCSKTTETTKVNTLKGKVNIWTSKYDESALMDAIALFKKQHPDVQINVTAMDSSALETNFSAKPQDKNTLPDLVTMNIFDNQKFLDKFSSKFLEVSSLSKFKKDSFVGGQISNGTISNKIYSLPWYENPIFIIYREDLLKASNFKAEDIKTWNQYKDIGASIFTSTGKGMLSMDYFNNGDIYNYGYNELGISYYDKDSKVNLLTDYNNRLCNTINNMYINKVFFDDSKNCDKTNSFIKGNTMSLISDLSTIKDIENRHPNLKGKLIVEKLPAFEEGGNRNAISYGSNIMALKATANNGAALEFMEFLSMNSEYALNEYNKFGNMTSNETLYTDKTYYKQDNFYLDKSLGRIAVDEVEGLRDVYYPKDFDKIRDSIVNSIIDCSTNNKNLTESITNLQNNLLKENSTTKR